MSEFSFALSVTGPIFIVVVLGFVFRRSGMIDANFVQTASLLVFRVGLPAILFLGVYQAGGNGVSGLRLGGFLGALTMLLVMLSWVVARAARLGNDSLVVVQGAFRGNLGIVGLAFCANTYGPGGLAEAAMPMGILTVLYNLIAAVMFGDTGSDKGRGAVLRVLNSAVRNPLIVSILAGFAYRATGLPLPVVIAEAGEYFAGMTLPLALLCIGASLNLDALRSGRGAVMAAGALKLVVAPVLFTTLAYAAGWRGQSLGIVFFFAAAPTATASYIMVKAVRGNESLAAAIVAFTTVVSLFTVTAGVLMLKSLDLL